MMGSYHQAQEFFEIIFNRKKYEALPKDLQALLRYAAEAASTSNYALAMDNYSHDLQELKDKHHVHVLRTPQGIFDAQLKGWDVLVKRISDEDPFFAKVWQSQKAWAKRVGYYNFFNSADYKAAYEHLFGKLGF
jgi:TRAP-type mannitol/chloroaromatic compound transport system substrate-binding protein